MSNTNLNSPEKPPPPPSDPATRAAKITFASAVTVALIGLLGIVIQKIPLPSPDNSRITSTVEMSKAGAAITMVPAPVLTTANPVNSVATELPSPTLTSDVLGQISSTSPSGVTPYATEETQPQPLPTATQLAPLPAIAQWSDEHMARKSNPHTAASAKRRGARLASSLPAFLKAGM